jgi:hypothetical protein
MIMIDDNKPVWPTWAVGALFRSVRRIHTVVEYGRVRTSSINLRRSVRRSVTISTLSGKKDVVTYVTP